MVTVECLCTEVTRTLTYPFPWKLSPSRMASHCLAWGLGIYPSARVRTIWKSNSIKPQEMEMEATWLYFEGLQSGCMAWRDGSREIPCNGSSYRCSSFHRVHMKHYKLGMDASVVHLRLHDRYLGCYSPQLLGCGGYQ